MKQSTRERLYERLYTRMRIDEATGCWLWTGPGWFKRKSPGHRYGYIGVSEDGKARTLSTHRAMWFAVHGPIPSEVFVCHKCDVPLCINPDHLFLGSCADNNKDMHRKRRYWKQRNTHCPRGHELSGENLMLHKGRGDGKVWRACKACQRGRQRVLAGWPEDLAYSMPAQKLGKRAQGFGNKWRQTRKPKRPTSSPSARN